MRFLRIEKRLNPSWKVFFSVSILSIFLAFFIIGFIFLGYGISPIKAYIEILIETVGNFYGITQIIWQSIPLLLCGVGLLLAFRASFWNIGAEGQLLMGAVAATWAALFSGLPDFLMIPMIFIFGFIGGLVGAFIHCSKGQIQNQRGNHYPDDELYCNEYSPLSHPWPLERGGNEGIRVHQYFS